MFEYRYRRQFDIAAALIKSSRAYVYFIKLMHSVVDLLCFTTEFGVFFIFLSLIFYRTQYTVPIPLGAI